MNLNFLNLELDENMKQIVHYMSGNMTTSGLTQKTNQSGKCY